MGLLSIAAVILGSEIGDSLGPSLPAHFPRIQASELGDEAWDLYEKKIVEKVIPPMKELH